MEGRKGTNESVCGAKFGLKTYFPRSLFPLLPLRLSCIQYAIDLGSIVSVSG
jgi:hypothetical protein